MTGNSCPWKAPVIAVFIVLLMGCDEGTADSDAGPDDGIGKTGTLLRGIHHTLINYSAGEEAGVVWLPLPLDYAAHTPLYVELSVDPEEAFDGVDYLVDDLGNFGALISLVEGGEAQDAEIHWESVVLTRDVGEEERPFFYAATSDVSEWSVATPVADAEYDEISEIGEELAEGAPSALERMIAVIEWTSHNIDYVTDWTGFEGFDATSTYEWGKSSCTGFANLASALGRAAGVPTRTVANYFVGLSQQTHYINEFYLGEQLGWRRVEPQETDAVLPEEYSLPVRLVRTTDEDAEALTMGWVGDAPGIPTYSLIEVVEGKSNVFPNIMSNYFEDCPYCDNRADLQAELVGTGEDMAAVFERARELWQRDLSSYVDGDIDSTIMDARRAALEAATLSDVEAILDEIE